VIKISTLRRGCHQLCVRSITITDILSCQRPNAFINYLTSKKAADTVVYDAASPPADKEETDYPKYKYSTGSEMISTTTFLPYLPCTYAHTHPVIRGWHKLILLRRGKTINQIPYVHTLCTYLMYIPY